MAVDFALSFSPWIANEWYDSNEY